MGWLVCQGKIHRIQVKRTKYVYLTEEERRIYQDDAWLLIRKSGTEPLIRVYSDATSLARAEELVQIGEGIVHRVISQLVK